MSDTPTVAETGAPHELNELQQRAYDVLSKGGSWKEAAEAAGRAEGTIGRWKTKFGWEFSSERLEVARQQTEAARVAADTAWVKRRAAEADACGVAATVFRSASITTARRVDALIRSGGGATADDLSKMAAAAKSLMSCAQMASTQAELLSGNPTERIETAPPVERVRGLVDELRERRQRHAS